MLAASDSGRIRAPPPPLKGSALKEKNKIALVPTDRLVEGDPEVVNYNRDGLKTLPAEVDRLVCVFISILRDRI